MRVPVKIIHRTKDLKSGYLIRLELGFIISLGLVLGITKMEIRKGVETEVYTVQNQEIVQLEEIVQTRQKPVVPPPPRPVVPIEVPNDEIIESEIIDIDAELDLDDFIALPPPPPALEPLEKEEEEEMEIFIIVEQFPELVGGLKNFQKTIVYPEMAMLAGIEGRVVVQFIVDTEGKVNNPVVIRGIGGGCDEEALRAVSNARFIPGKQRGRPVNVKFSLPVNFKLNKQVDNSN